MTQIPQRRPLGNLYGNARSSVRQNLRAASKNEVMVDVMTLRSSEIVYSQFENDKRTLLAIDFRTKGYHCNTRRRQLRIFESFN